MRTPRVLFGLAFGLALTVACGEEEPQPPSQPEVEASLRQEAEAMKSEGEQDINPALGVEVTWTVLAVDVRPQPGNAAEPFAGTIQFRIRSEMNELDDPEVDEFERSYDYAWSMQTKSWQMR